MDKKTIYSRVGVKIKLIIDMYDRKELTLPTIPRPSKTILFTRTAQR